jgi:hypothetical protein
VRPEMPVIAGAIANHGESTRDATGYEVMSLGDFLEEMLRAGAQPAMDAVSFHPYLGTFQDGGDETAEAHVQSEQQVETAYEEAGKPIDERLVVTEFGASTSDGYSQALQRSELVSQFRAWDTNSSSVPLADRVDAAFLHEAVENPHAAAGGNPWQMGFGLTKVKDARGRFAIKRAYCAFRTTFGGFSGCPPRLQGQRAP